jgi:hypothetical protein
MESLTYEPHFAKYVRDSFSPVGLMIDMWDTRYRGGDRLSIPIYIVNDFYNDWNGDIQLRLEESGRVISKQSKSCEVESLGRSIVTFDQLIPQTKGEFMLIAEIYGKDGEPVRSCRDITVCE